MKDTLPKGGFLISLMSQYTPFYRSADYPEINRRITTYEYEKVLNTAIELGLPPSVWDSPRGSCRKKAVQKKNIRPHLNSRDFKERDGIYFSPHR